MLPAVYIPEPTINSSPSLFVINNEDFNEEFQHVLDQTVQITFINNLKAVGAATWSNIILDMCGLFWKHFSSNPCGRDPSPNLCIELLRTVFDRRSMVDPGWALDHVTVTVQISKGVTFSKNNFEEITVNTDVNNQSFMNAIRRQISLCLVATTYQACAWSNAQWLVYSIFEHVGIIPLPEEMPADFKEQLAKALVWDDSRGYNIFHWAPDVVTPDGMQFSAPLYFAESHAAASTTAWIVMALRDYLSVGRRCLLPTTKYQEVVTIMNMVRDWLDDNRLSKTKGTVSMWDAMRHGSWEFLHRPQNLSHVHYLSKPPPNTFSMENQGYCFSDAALFVVLREEVPTLSGGHMSCISSLLKDTPHGMSKELGIAYSPTLGSTDGKSPAKSSRMDTFEANVRLSYARTKVIEDVENEAGEHLSRETIADLHSKYYKSRDRSMPDGQFIATISGIVVNPIACTPAPS
ncbi:hypothetical protein PAXINDRAFT_153421 [Paxillus involutus ATCC 200175]|nr:hypothetical protein PAXINDRAFT_153421 [Paxillus involutus ATCC 200175]